MRKESIRNHIKPVTGKLIIEIFLILISIFVFQAYYENQKTKDEIDYHFDKADYFLNKSQFEKAIDEYNEAVKLSYNKFPYEYASAQNNLGGAYVSLARIRDAEVNAQNAIYAFQEALEFFTIGKYPYEYAQTQNNLGGAYNTLSIVRDKEKNVQNAIDAFQKALEVFTVEKYPY